MKNSSQSGRANPYPSRRRLAKATIAGPPWVKIIFFIRSYSPINCDTNNKKQKNRDNFTISSYKEGIEEEDTNQSIINALVFEENCHRWTNQSS